MIQQSKASILEHIEHNELHINKLSKDLEGSWAGWGNTTEAANQIMAAWPKREAQLLKQISELKTSNTALRNLLKGL